MKKVINHRTFGVARGEHRAPQMFSAYEQEDGSVQVTSIHTYDETEYHWASKSTGRASWRIIRGGTTRSAIGPLQDGTPLTPEQVALFLIKADEDAHLARTGGIW